jgi:uncharacterized protein YndB with AHSA1/START domain
VTDPESTTATKRVEQTLRIQARPETVWRYWTDPERMSQWWGAAAQLDPRPGGICRVERGDGPVMRGEFLELVPYERIVFSFGWEPIGGVSSIPPRSTTVEVTLTAHHGDTILTLRHIGIPARDADEHGAGWERYLTNLARAAHQG